MPEDRYGRDIFGKAGEVVKEAIKKKKEEHGKLHYPYDEEELKDRKKWKDNKLKAELIKLRKEINKVDIESDLYDTLTTELAKLQKEANERGLFLSAEEKKKRQG